MNLARFAVQRYQFTIVIFAMLAALGASSLLAIPKAEDPTFPIPTYLAIAIYPGASPADIEKLVVDPLEEKLKALDDLKSLKTEIRDSVAVIAAEFVAGVDADKKYDDVLREVNAVRPKLPAALQSLEVKRFNAANVNIIQLALVSQTASFRTLEAEAERLKKQLENLPGVKDAAKWAVPSQEVRVALDPEKLAALGLSPLQVLGALQATDVNIPAGSIDLGRRKFNVKTSGDFASIEEVRDTVVTSADGALVRVRDVATVAIQDEDQNYLGRFNGERAVFVTATMKEKQNIFSVRPEVAALQQSFARQLPPGTRLETGFDQATNVSHRLKGFVRDFLLAIGLVLLTLLPLGLRASLIVMISIPLSLAMGVSGLNFTGFSINQLSIVGFVIALGLLVDDSIVVIENITRFQRLGHPRREAAILATQQILLPVLGCTATLLFAFLPILFLPGIAGQFIRSLPLAVVFTVLASLLVALTIIPFLASLILPKEESEEGNWAFRLLHRAIEATYDRVLHRVLAHPYLTLVAALLLVGGALALVPVVGFSLFPKAGTPWFLVKIETPDGSSLAETDRVARLVERRLLAQPEVASVVTNVGHGNPQIYYNVTPEDLKANFAELFVGLHDFDARATPALYQRLRAELSREPAARVELKEFENGPQIDAPIALRVIGDDLGALDTAARQVEQVLRDTAGTTYVKNPSRDRQADLRLTIDRAQAGLLGVTVGDIDRGVRIGVAGISAGSYREDGQSDDAYAINVVLPPAGAKPQLSALDRVYLPTNTGAQVPLFQLAQLGFEGSPTHINHYGKERVVTVTSDVLPGFNTDRVTKAVLTKLDAIRWPDGVRLMPAGEIESRQESFGGLGSAVLVAAFGILAVLVLEFGTFRGTLIVASVIPLGLVGGILALFLTGNTLSFTASIGFIALIGIEVKNSILLVDFTNQLRAEGLSVDAAIEKAGETRFVPILLTTLTALGGLVPLALENSALYSPLAWVIIGGLITSTVLTRLVTPVVYKLLAPEVALAPAAPVPVAVS